MCYELVMTNKPRKRAPGGGRKPAGPYSNKLATLSTRITQELRERLDQETERHRAERGAAPWSLSQEIEQRLRHSLTGSEEITRQWGPPHVRALAYLISRVVRSVEASAGGNPFEMSDQSWHRSTFTHAAVLAAISEILDHYKPSSSVVDDSAVLSPQGVGISCARGLLSQVATTPSPAFPPPANAHYAEGFYTFPDIRQILDKEPQK
jgi:hypothetical protein